MTDPLVPNYKKNVGRLVTDRYDFETHINGTEFRHNATHVDLFPSIVIDGTAKTTVQDAISALADVIYSAVLPDATISSKGIVKLSGDIAGTADSVVVTRIQGKPVSTLMPSSGQVLTWSGSYWEAETPTNFSAGLDLSGTNLLQRVIQISGNLSGEVAVKASSFIFDVDASPYIYQQTVPLSGGDASDFSIIAQSSVSGAGGNLILNSGEGATENGSIQLLVPDTNGIMIQLSKFADSRKVIGLLHGTSLTDTDVPSGDLVLYIKDAATNPTLQPVDGALLYSSDGALNILQSDGVSFKVGSNPNPNLWGDDDQYSYTERKRVQTTNSSPETIFFYAIPPNTSVKVDVIIIGKEVGSSNSVQFSMSAGYSTDSLGMITAVGSTQLYDERNTGAPADSWIKPDIFETTPYLYVKTGAAALTTIDWFAIIQLTVVKD